MLVLAKQKVICTYHPSQIRTLSSPSLQLPKGIDIITVTFVQEIILVYAVYQLMPQSFKYQVKNPRGVDTLQ